MRVQLWSYNYDPEPTGIGPLSRVWAHAMRDRGHDIEVVAAHPHYPEPRWGSCHRPYREVRDGIKVTRLPLWVGRRTAAERMRQEASFATALGLVSPLLSSPDVIVAVSPSFPALGPTMLHARMRRVPWVLWLQDILPDGAAATGLVNDGSVMRMARKLELSAYRSATQIAVLSESFKDNLRAKGVPDHKLVRVYNPASRTVARASRPTGAGDPGHVLTMGNVGHSQGLVDMVRAFETAPSLERLRADFTIAGDGVAGDDVRAAIRTDRVRVTGILDDESLGSELRRAKVAVVSQNSRGTEFNVPSKLANFMGADLPVVASVDPGGEVARLVRESGCGWVTDSTRPEDCAAKLAEALGDEGELARRGTAGLAFAQRHFTPERTADRFELMLAQAIEENPDRSTSMRRSDAGGRDGSGHRVATIR